MIKEPIAARPAAPERSTDPPPDQLTALVAAPAEVDPKALPTRAVATVFERDITGTLDIVQRCYTGLEARARMIWLSPTLPDELPSLSLDLFYRGHWLMLQITRDRLRISSQPFAASPVRIGVRGAIYEVSAGTALEIILYP